MTASTENTRENDAIKIKSVGNAQNRTCKNLCRSIMIRLTTVPIDARDERIMSHRKKYPIKLCASLTAKFLPTSYKSKIIKFKLDEDPLQH